MALESAPSSEDDYSRENAATSRADGSVVTTYATTFQPPSWIVMPTEASSAVRFEVMRVSKSCGVCELGKKIMSVFGREQDGSDFILANPSVSRKHAAIIHCAKGGVYLVDLMSRHGTFVGKTKIPPHDPFLLHEGDIVTFGQSCRTYVLKGADPKGLSQPQKRTWPKLSLPSFFNHGNGGAGTAKKPPPPKKCSDACIKMVNKVCSGSYKPEKGTEFTHQVSELDDEQVEEIAYLLVEKVRQNNSNAHHVILALLGENMGLKEFEANLSTIVQVSQNNLEARKILQTIAEARIEHGPKTPSGSDDDDDYDEPEGESSYAPPSADAYAPPVIPYAPPSTAYVAPTVATTPQPSRERVLSDEGKRLFVSAIEGKAAHVHNVPVDLDDDEDEEKEDFVSSTGVAPPSSGFSFLTRENSPVHEAAAPSAFGFLSGLESVDGNYDGSNDDDDDDDHVVMAPSCVEDDMPQVVVPDGFLTEPSMDPLDFENLWQSATSSEEWAVELVPYFDTDMMERSLGALPNVKILASGKMDGVHKFYYYAEQASNGTIFMVEIQVMESVGELSATFKWIELGLLFDDGHLLFIQLFKECLEPCYVMHHPRTASLTHAVPPSMKKQPAPAPVLTIESVVDLASMEAALSSYPELDPALFESLWIESIPISELEDPEEREIGGVDAVILHFQARKLFCLASGARDNVDKFYFYAAMPSGHELFFVELSISRPDGALVALCKMFAPAASVDVQDHLAPLFVELVEDILAELE
ncbi:Aste57867_21605 [Aphanomyces stellatus]|uniref:Aste57867_21605 protein n=1 Tax=Aphanomyces stellatus TaxID=120398 RepID=A0A485LJ81_9STRA|nr:hypothetical protein As57867_021536 [Aphanomyces stellatus]VFT98275.1 Aste57867_21605 [Aphanomyces stellatus]